MTRATIVAALGTPLHADEGLHHEGFTLQLERVRSAGIDGVFVAGTFGMSPLLTDETYHALIRHAVSVIRGGVELFVGASDQSLARTRQRIAFINGFNVDGVVVLPPYFIRFSQPELIAYFHALADESRAPLYLYDLPQRTHVQVAHETVLALAEHPNIAGIKCSGPIAETRKLIDALAKQSAAFRVMVAQPDRLRRLILEGVRQHLDGIYTLAPQWTMQLARHQPSADDEQDMAQVQADLSELRDVLRNHGGMSAMSVLLNACGVPGCFAPLPFRKLGPTQRQTLLDEPIVRKFLATEHAVSAKA